jgi:hypothetical protein
MGGHGPGEKEFIHKATAKSNAARAAKPFPGTDAEIDLTDGL